MRGSRSDLEVQWSAMWLRLAQRKEGSYEHGRRREWAEITAVLRSNCSTLSIEKRKLPSSPVTHENAERILWCSPGTQAKLAREKSVILKTSSLLLRRVSTSQTPDGSQLEACRKEICFCNRVAPESSSRRQASSHFSRNRP